MIIEILTESKHTFVLKIKDKSLDVSEAKQKAVDFIYAQNLVPVSWSSESDEYSAMHDIDFEI